SVERTLKATDTALVTAQQDLKQDLSDQQTLQAKLDKLVRSLESKNPDEVQKARTDLALLGQDAVKRLIKEIQNRSDKTGNEDNAVRLQIATAFRRMRQPIIL